MNLLIQILSDLGLDSAVFADSPSVNNELRDQMRWRSNAAWQLRQQLRWGQGVPEHLWRTQGELPPEREAIRTRMLWILEVIESCWHEAAHALAAEETGQEWRVAWTPGEMIGTLPRIWGVTICTDADGKTRLPALLEVALAPSRLTITSGASGVICTELSADDADAAATLLRHMSRKRGGLRLPWKKPELPRVLSGDDRWPEGSPGRSRLVSLARTALERWPYDLHSDHGQQLEHQTIEALLEASLTRPEKMTRAIMEAGVPASETQNRSNN